MKQDLSNGHGIGYSVFGGQGYDKGDAQRILDLNTALNNGVKPAKAWATTMGNASIAAQDAARNCLRTSDSLKDLANGIRVTTVASKAAELGLKALSIAGNMLLSIGISMAISAVVKGLSNLANAQENAIEKADEFISKFNEQQKSLTETKSTIDSISEDYERLADGVDSLGRNVSLSGSEYERYNEIVNKIADMFPQMVQGYTDEGNAIIATKGNVEELTKAYEYQKKVTQDALIVGSADVFKGYKAKVDYVATISWEESGLKQMKDIVDEIVATGGDIDKIKDFLNDNTNHVAMKDVFDKAGLSANSGWGINDNLVDENYISENLTKFQALARTLNAEIATETAKIKPIMQAYLEQSYAYQSLDDDTADMVKQIVSNFDSEFYSQFKNETQMASFVEENIIEKLKGEDGKEIAKSFSELFTNTELSPEQKNNLIKQIQDYFGEDNPISIFLQPQFEENETTQKNIDKAISKAQEKFGKEGILKQLKGYNKKDTIDFTVRPVIDTSKLKEKGWDDAGEGTSTVYSSTYYSEDFGMEEGKALVITPILPNGNVLTKEELDEYARKILSGEDVGVDIKMGMFDGGNYKEEADEFANTIHELHEKYFSDGNDVDWKKYFNDQSINTQEELDKWNEVTANAKTAEDAMQMWADAISDSVKGVTSSLEKLDEVSDKIGKLSAAYKELSDDGYITIGTINEIKDATGLSGDEWTAYETKLLNAKKGSAEFNQVMSDLTYKIIENNVSIGDLKNATDEEVAAIEKKIAATLRENGVTNASAVAHDYVNRVKETARIKSVLLTGVTYDEVVALATEAAQAGITGNAFNELIIDIGILNNTALDPSQKVQALQEIGYYASWTAQQIASIGSVKSYSVDGKKGFATYDKDGNLIGIEQYNNDYTPPSFTPPTIPTYNSKTSGSGSKSSGSDKNDALDNYLEDAERRYKIHQDETKYINDLNYALLNLAKTEEERRDILDDIEQAHKDYADNQVKDIEHQIEMLQNLKGETVDVLDYYDQIQDIAHDEADRLRSIGYDDNSNEVQEWQSKWWDAQDKKMNFYSQQHEDIIGDIEHARDMALAKNPYTDTTSYYKQMQDEYHKLAELYRSIDSEKYKKEIQELQQSWQDAQQSIVDWRWENSQNWINQRKAFNDWGLFGDSEIKAWERVIDWLKTEYPEALDKIRDAEQSLYDARKEQFSKATDLMSSYLDSQKTLLQSYYDVTNSVAEAQHEITKELEASKTMYEYLNEDTRKLLFNQEDYNILSEELYDIQYRADKLQRQYQYDLENATLDTIEEITSNYEMQYETLMKSYEVAKAELEVAKKRQQLDNVLNERNVRMFIDGQWQWVANTQDVIDAQSELADAEYARKTAEAESRQTTSINNLTKQQDELGTVINKFESGVITLEQAVSDVSTALGGIPSIISSALSGTSSKYSSSSSSSSSAANATAWIPGVGTMPVYVDSNGKTQSSLPVGSVVTTNGGSYKITGGTAGNYTSVKIDDKYASGSGNTRAGNILVGEEEPEILVTKYGNLIPVEQPTLFKNMQAGGKVFNGAQMQNLETLWNMSNMQMPTFDGVVRKTQSSVVNNDNSYHVYFQGVEIDSGVIDIDKLKRYVGNH